MALLIDQNLDEVYILLHHRPRFFSVRLLVIPDLLLQFLLMKDDPPNPSVQHLLHRRIHLTTYMKLTLLLTPP